ncbi:MAG: transposase [bacterium]
MTKKRKTYTKEFKIEAVRLLKRSGRSQEAIAQELGTSSSSLSRWKKKYGEDSEDASPGHRNLTPEKEGIGQLGHENEILSYVTSDHISCHRFDYHLTSPRERSAHSRSYDVPATPQSW